MRDAIFTFLSSLSRRRHQSVPDAFVLNASAVPSRNRDWLK